MAKNNAHCLSPNANFRRLKVKTENNWLFNFIWS